MERVTDMLTKALESESAAELYYSSRTRLKMKAFRNQIADLTSATDKSVAARAIREQKVGTSSTERITEQTIERLIQNAKANTEYVGADPGNVLNAKPETGAFDARQGDANSLSMDEKKAAVLAAEQAALSYDERIVNVPYCNYEEVDSSQAIANSFGVTKSQASGYCYFYVSVMAKVGDETQTAMEYDAAPDASGIGFEAVARKAAETALAKLGASEVDSGSYPVVFDADSASKLLSAFVASPGSPFYGENIQKGRSMLAGKEGERIGSDLLTIVDDPQSGIVPRFFDGEGVETRRTVLVENGIFRTIIHNLYSAAREDGAESTGHGSRGRGGVSTSLHRPMLQAGSGTLEDLLQEMSSGLLLTEVDGLHAGLNPVTGDFSLSAKGFMVENGKKSYAVRNLVVAGNFFDLAKNLTAVADDARAISLQSLTAPSILVSELSVSGK